MTDFTIAEFARRCEIDRNTAGQVLRFFVQQGQIEVVAKRKSGGRGKPATIFRVPDTLTYNLPKAGV